MIFPSPPRGQQSCLKLKMGNEPCYCTWAFSSCSAWGLLFVTEHWLLILVGSLATEHRL